MKKTTKPTAHTPPAAAPATPAPAVALAKPAPKDKEYPEWLLNNYGGIYTYELMVSEEGGGSVQAVPVTRAEYRQLKMCLAYIRKIVSAGTLDRYVPRSQES
jgi:hypothetical protein